MKRFVAYFDYLGYKQFVLNNTLDEIRRRLGQILRDIEHATAEHRAISSDGKLIIIDKETVKVKCVNFSDTIIFYSNGETQEDLINILKTAYKFNWVNNRYNFPVRGIIVYDEIDFLDDRINNHNGEEIFSYNMMYGKGLAEANIKCDNQEWAGCCIDNSILSHIRTREVSNLFGQIAIKYPVPLKCKTPDYTGYALRMYEGGANTTLLASLCKSIEDRFTSDNKKINSAAQVKIDNTKVFIRFLADK